MTDGFVDWQIDMSGEKNLNGKVQLLKKKIKKKRKKRKKERKKEEEEEEEKSEA